MRRLAFSLLGMAVLSAPPAEVRAQRSEYPLITEVYDEAGQLPPVADGKRAMPVR